MPRRTLAEWVSCHDGHFTCRLRGRPCLEASLEEQYEVLEVIETIGPHVGLPSLRALFPDVPRCVLLDLQSNYRQLYREQNRIAVYQLKWTIPGRVWAMDHADPPLAIAGEHEAIFAVRDLASGMQLAWVPTPDKTAEVTLPMLERLFCEYGAPLVLKSDNGSAFTSEAMRALLEKYRVVPLFSPPATPSYNGSCEAGIGSLKTHTSYQAARHGSSTAWTLDDLVAAQRHVNEVHHSAPCAATAIECWKQRTAVTMSERQIFRDAIERHRTELIASWNRKNSCTTANQAATIERITIRQVLVELGMLTLKRRSITLPIKTNNLAKL